jgi:hypothetical protein
MVLAAVELGADHLKREQQRLHGIDAAARKSAQRLRPADLIGA